MLDFETSTICICLNSSQMCTYFCKDLSLVLIGRKNGRCGLKAKRLREGWLLNLKIDDYAKDGGPGEVWILCSFYHESLRT